MRLIVIFSCLFVYLLYLAIERVYLSLIIDDIPTRICITGSRGKSSVVRLVYSALNQNGVRTLGKTTGSRPSLLLPDGTEEEISRRGPQSILEQRKILKKARRYDVDAFVIEMMGIKPEYKYAESVKMLKPGILGVTKITVDHVFEMGNSKKEVSESIAASLPDDASVVVGDNDFLSHSSRFLEGSEIVPVRETERTRSVTKKVLDKLDYWEFEENVQLALAITDQADIPRKEASKGMCETRPDLGSLRAWSLSQPDNEVKTIAVNGFAANDPESTEIVFNKMKSKVSVEGKHLAGLLNLREDRGGRTRQWKKALTEDFTSFFDWIYVTGDQAKEFEKLFGQSSTTVQEVNFADPESLTSQISQNLGNEVIIFGFGNIGGAGKELVLYWSKRGKVL